VVELFSATLCSVRVAVESASGRLPSVGEGFEMMLDHALQSWGVEDPWLRRRSRRSLAIFERDGWRCTVPGCTSRRNLQLHHIRFRSAGGGDEEGNLTTLCAFHYLRGVHDGRVRIAGSAPDGLRFELGVRPGREPRWFATTRTIGSPGTLGRAARWGRTEVCRRCRTGAGVLLRKNPVSHSQRSRFFGPRACRGARSRQDLSTRARYQSNQSRFSRTNSEGGQPNWPASKRFEMTPAATRPE